MLKSDLIAMLVAKRQLTQKQAEQTVETIFEAMKDALCRGDNIEIRGLGAFHVKQYQGYNGRNPKTGEVIPVKPKRGILFRTGKDLRERVNTGAQPAGGGSKDGRPARPEGTIQLRSNFVAVRGVHRSCFPVTKAAVRRNAPTAGSFLFAPQSRSRRSP